MQNVAEVVVWWLVQHIAYQTDEAGCVSERRRHPHSPLQNNLLLKISREY